VRTLKLDGSQTALNTLTVRYARELARTSIKVTGAAPGHVATDFNASAAPGPPNHPQTIRTSQH
jgi:NAD(P)-dependent dehydrogenase (short-subunit alcohol dehydrogenase family)